MIRLGQLLTIASPRYDYQRSLLLLVQGAFIIIELISYNIMISKKLINYFFI